MINAANCKDWRSSLLVQIAGHVKIFFREIILPRQEVYCETLVFDDNLRTRLRKNLQRTSLVEMKSQFTSARNLLLEVSAMDGYFASNLQRLNVRENIEASCMYFRQRVAEVYDQPDQVKSNINTVSRSAVTDELSADPDSNLNH